MEYAGAEHLFSGGRIPASHSFRAVPELCDQFQRQEGRPDDHLCTAFYLHRCFLRYDSDFPGERRNREPDSGPAGNRTGGLPFQSEEFPAYLCMVRRAAEYRLGSIMYISVLASVGPELHEAARVDGATKFQRMLYIDIPSIVPTMVIMLIMRAGEIMDVGFEKAFLLQNSVNLDYSEIISTYVYKIGIQSGQFSYSAAIGLFNNIINLILLLAVNRIAGKASDVSLW